MLKTQTKLWQYKLTVLLEKVHRCIIYTKVFGIQNTREISSNTVSETRVLFLGCYGMNFPAKKTEHTFPRTVKVNYLFYFIILR